MTACFTGGAPLTVQFAVKARAVQTKKKKMSWSNGYNYCLLQRGNGYYEDSEDSQSSQETDSSSLVDEYKKNGESENVAQIKAQNALLPVYRKELRKYC